MYISISQVNVLKLSPSNCSVPNSLSLPFSNYSSATTQVVFKAADVNDHSPVFQQQEYRVAVDESSMVNHRFLQVTATDDDLGM